MDAKKNNGPLIAAGGGGLLLISLFLSWFGDFSAWEVFDLTDIVLFVIAALAIAVGGSIAAGNPINVPGGPAGSLSTAGLIAVGMVGTWAFEGDERKFGLFVAVVGVIAIIVGALQLAQGAGSSPATRTPTAPPPPPPPPSSGV